MRILLTAYACEPGKSSEPGVGWNWAKQIARFHEVWVITRANNRRVIEAELAREPCPNLHPVYFDLPYWTRFWKRGMKVALIYHRMWSRALLGLARDLHRRIHFDVCHHVTFGGIWDVSWLCDLGIPFVWGPIGGGEGFYEPVARELPLTVRGLELGRRIVASYHFDRSPIAERSFERACRVLVRTQETMHRIPERWRHKAELFLETGWPGEVLTSPKRTGGANLLASGWLIPRKNYLLAVDALPAIVAVRPDTKLVLLGEGRQRHQILERARTLRVADHLELPGRVSRQEVLAAVAKADVFLHPSLRDGGTWSVMEALAAGVPVVCLAYSGPAAMVDESCGVRVAGRDRAEVVDRFGRAVIELLQDPDRASRLSAGAIERVRRHFLWDRVGERIDGIYREACA